MIQVCCAIIIEESKILITQNPSGSDHPFQWEFPGGKVHPNESEKACIVREIKEELDVEVTVLGKLVPVEHDYGIKQIRLIPFVCEIIKGDIQLHTHSSKRWIKPKELESIDFSEADKVLINLKENKQLLKKYIGE